MPARSSAGSVYPRSGALGYPFRRGLFPIPEPDFRMIAEAMGASWPAVGG